MTVMYYGLQFPGGLAGGSWGYPLHSVAITCVLQVFYKCHIIGFVGFWTFSFMHYQGLLQYCTAGMPQQFRFVGCSRLCTQSRVAGMQCLAVAHKNTSSWGT